MRWPKNLTARQVERALRQDSFQFMRQVGSHRTYAKGSLRVTLPVHPGQTLRRGTLRGIVKDAGWSEEDLRRLGLLK
ncbi:MAG: type II toxin-antitoxin system HicA family toxin [Deinococcus sp.]|nr:type II toxin-antitoxin system HicA family toxin [Deinococcus sp.]